MRGAGLEVALARVEAAQEQQRAFASEVQLKLDERLAEAAALDSENAELAQEIRNQKALITRREKEIKRKAELARRQAAIPNIVGTGEIVSVGGIRVHKSVAQNVANMFTAAAQDDIFLGGGGYRSASSQVALRRAHCGTSNYEIYSKPSATCRPPTARPGHSMHERGLALDLTANGRAITSRDTAAFRWLKANAATYGYYNLPSEPWPLEHNRSLTAETLRSGEQLLRYQARDSCQHRYGEAAVARPLLRIRQRALRR